MSTTRRGYFPTLSLRTYEVKAARELESFFQSRDDVWPVLIMVPGKSLSKKFLKSLSTGSLHCYLAWDPQEWTTEDLTEVVAMFPSTWITPTLKFTRTTSESNIRTFRRRTGSGPFAVAIESTDADTEKFVELVQDQQCEKIFVDGAAVPLSLASLASKVVHIERGFRPAARNRDYHEDDFFSRRFATWQTDGLAGFGDYQIIDPTKEPGGPARAVAIHVSYRRGQEGVYIRHFVSDDVDGVENPGGKFLQAVKKLADCHRTERIFLESSGLRDLLHCHSTRHYPNLGSVKTYSIKHHIETMASIIRSS